MVFNHIYWKAVKDSRPLSDVSSQNLLLFLHDTLRAPRQIPPGLLLHLSPKQFLGKQSGGSSLHWVTHLYQLVYFNFTLDDWFWIK